MKKLISQPLAERISELTASFRTDPMLTVEDNDETHAHTENAI